jgi:hypothetical protein
VEKDRSFPTSIAGIPIVSVVDLTLGYDSRKAPSYKPSLPISSGHMIQFRAGRAEDPVKLILTTRTSGTEPKVILISIVMIASTEASWRADQVLHGRKWEGFESGRGGAWKCCG